MCSKIKIIISREKYITISSFIYYQKYIILFGSEVER